MDGRRTNALSHLLSRRADSNCRPAVYESGPAVLKRTGSCCSVREMGLLIPFLCRYGTPDVGVLAIGLAIRRALM